VAFAFAALVGACAPPSGTVRTTEWHVGETTLTLRPPGDRQPALSSFGAYQRCLFSGGCGRGAPTVIELAVVIDPGTNIIAPEGTLCWALEWLDVVCPPSRGPGAGGPPGRCDVIGVVDATSGVFLFEQSGPHDPARR